MAKSGLVALRYSSEIVDDVTQLVYLHLRFHTYRMGWTDSAVRRYVHDAGPLLDELNELTLRLHDPQRRKAQALANRMDELEARIAVAGAGTAREDPARSRRQRGHAVPGVRPGPVVGEAKTLLELRLEEGPLGKEAAYERLAAGASAASNPRRSGSDRCTT
jgi:poly(A) polymerase